MTARLPVTPHGTGRTRVVGATVLDGTLAPPRPDAEVEVVDGRIGYVGPRRTAEQVRAAGASGARVVDATGYHLTPGFVDLHVHACMPNDAGPEQIAQWFPEEEAFATARSLRQTLEAGVTTARDLSGLTPGFRNAVAAGHIDGPRLHLAVALLSPTGGHGDPAAPNGALPVYAQRATTPGWRVVDTADEVLRTVRRLDRTGADVIKVCTSGGLSSNGDDPGELGVPQEHVALIVAEMRRRRNQPVTAHAQSEQGIREAVRGGAASIEHGYGLTDDLIEEMLERGTVLVPTLAVLHRIPEPGTVPQEKIDRKLWWRDTGTRAIARAVEAGVTIGTGTDAGIVPHGRNLAELGHLVDLGMSPLRAVHAGTLVGARTMGLDEHLGSVETGKLADLVLTRVDPLADVHALAAPGAVRAVWQSGRVVTDLDGIAAG
ncbi:amidohydrolase family protein [Cellulomonas sp. C5510]|uniref:metal-dependent hydrolase family protein n=1 Tax=Cellulomonas sp. C5510 TaxID=2871170 RepID=UPI001C952C72|nr:amidohydrolase family protein [Cellulomonas sp. C5510]QZN87015.1 amidohydrolase family protein [Cellulomonas sp. C5510]